MRIYGEYDFGTIDGLHDDVNGSLHIRPDGVDGVINICTTPTWGLRPEFIKIIDDEGSDNDKRVD